jgi:hypothetical protein
MLGISLSLSLSVFYAACQCFKTLFSVLNTCHFKIFKTTTCFGKNWPSSGVNPQVSQAGKETTRNRHTRETKGMNEHDWKETAIFLETSINT